MLELLNQSAVGSLAMGLLKRFRLALLYLLWTAAILTTLLFARAYDADRFNVGWGDLAAKSSCAVLWWEVIALMSVCVLLTIVIGLASRLAVYSITSAFVAAGLLVLLWAQGPHAYAYRVILLIPQFPGFFAAIIALGVHGDERLTAFWIVCINAILYAPIFYTALARRRYGPSLA